MYIFIYKYLFRFLLDLKFSRYKYTIVYRNVKPKLIGLSGKGFFCSAASERQSQWKVTLQKGIFNCRKLRSHRAKLKANFWFFFPDKHWIYEHEPCQLGRRELNEGDQLLTVCEPDFIKVYNIFFISKRCKHVQIVMLMASGAKQTKAWTLKRNSEDIFPAFTFSTVETPKPSINLSLSAFLLLLWKTT